MNQANVNRPRRAIVVGGSLGGLNAGLWLRRAGWQVDIYERESDELVSRGAGIVVQPSTVRYFQATGEADVDAMSVAVRYLRWLDSGGKPYYEEEPCPYRFTSWNALYRCYLDAFGRSHYHMGQRLVALNQDEQKATATFASGRTESADLLVCADGIGSTCRLLLSPSVRPLYAGYVAWRGLIEEAALPDDLDVFTEACTYRQMDHSQVIVYPVPAHDGAVGHGSRLLNWLWYRNVDEVALKALMTDVAGNPRGASVPPGFVQERHLAGLRDDAERSLPPRLSDLIARTDDPFLQVILDVRSPRMAFDRIVLMGDAAFAARPHTGAGTAKAAEDAWVLAEQLRDTLPADVPDALQRFEAQQLPLGEQLVERAARAGDISQFTGQWRPDDISLRMDLHRPGADFPRGEVRLSG